MLSSKLLCADFFYQPDCMPPEDSAYIRIRIWGNEQHATFGLCCDGDEPDTVYNSLELWQEAYPELPLTAEERKEVRRILINGNIWS